MWCNIYLYIHVGWLKALSQNVYKSLEDDPSLRNVERYAIIDIFANQLDIVAAKNGHFNEEEYFAVINYQTRISKFLEGKLRFTSYVVDRYINSWEVEADTQTRMIFLKEQTQILYSKHSLGTKMRAAQLFFEKFGKIPDLISEEGKLEFKNFVNSSGPEFKDPGVLATRPAKNSQSEYLSEIPTDHLVKYINDSYRYAGIEGIKKIISDSFAGLARYPSLRDLERHTIIEIRASQLARILAVKEDSPVDEYLLISNMQDRVGRYLVNLPGAKVDNVNRYINAWEMEVAMQNWMIGWSHTEPERRERMGEALKHYKKINGKWPVIDTEEGYRSFKEFMEGSGFLGGRVNWSISCRRFNGLE